MSIARRGSTDRAAEARRWRPFAAFADYKPGWTLPDLAAGLTLAAIAIPEQMATARLTSLPPQVGFFAFIAGTLAFVVFGSSRRMSVGADSTITPIFAGGLAMLAATTSPEYAVLAAGLAVAVGAIILAAGVLRMGWIGALLSTPVTTGFLAGIAVHIVASQLPGALGLPTPSGHTLHRLWAVARHGLEANRYDLAIAMGVLALIALAHRVSVRLPAPLVAIGAATVATAALHLEARGVRVLGHVPGGFPAFRLPAPDPQVFLQVLPLAFLVALVAMVQTAAVSRSFAPPGAEPDVDRDFIGLGASNLLAGLFGAFPVNASPPRTAIVAESGGRSQLTGLTAAAFIAALLAFGTTLLTEIPQAALAGVLLFVALRIIRVGQMRAIFAASRPEALLIAATAAGIIVLPIEIGVALGIGLSLLQGVWSSARMKVRPMRRIAGTTVWWPAPVEAAPEETAPADQPGLAVFTFQAPLSFLNADGFRRQLLAAIEPSHGAVKVAILEAAGIVDVDFTAAEAIKDVIARCQDAKVIFAVARLESVVAQRAFQRLGLSAALGEGRIFDTVAAAVQALGPQDGQSPA